MIRNLFEYANKRFSEAMVPEHFLAVEEYFYVLRTQVRFLPNRARTTYLCALFPNAALAGNGTHELIKQVVLGQHCFVVPPTCIATSQDKLGLKYNPVDINNARGMLFKAVNGVESQYTYRAHVFTTAPAETPSRYYQKTAQEEVQFMVREMGKRNGLEGRNLTTDRYIISCSL